MSDLHRITITAISGRYFDLHLKCIHPDAQPPEGGCFAARLLQEAIVFGRAVATPKVAAELADAVERDGSADIVLAIRFLAWAEKEATYRIEVRHERFVQHLRVGLTWESAAYTEWYESNEVDLMDLPKLEKDLKELFGEHPVPALLRQCLIDRAAGREAPLRDGKFVTGRIMAHLYGPSTLESYELDLITLAEKGLGSIVVFGMLHRPSAWTFGFLYTPGCSQEDPPVVGIRRGDSWPELVLVGSNLEDVLTRDLERPLEVPDPALLELERKLAPRYRVFLENEKLAATAVPVLSRHRCAELIDALFARVSTQVPQDMVSTAAIRILSAWGEKSLIPYLEQIMSDPGATDSEGWEVVAALGALGCPEAVPLLQKLARDPGWSACLKYDLEQAGAKLGVALFPPR